MQTEVLIRSYCSTQFLTCKDMSFFGALKPLKIQEIFLFKGERVRGVKGLFAFTW